MISLQPADDKQFSAVTELLERLRNLSGDDQRRIADAVRFGFLDNFRNERAGDEGDWPSLSNFTIKERAKRGFGPRPIQVQTGSFRDSWTKRGAAGHIEKFSAGKGGWSLDVGSGDERVNLLGFGGVNGLGYYVPPRPVVFLSEDAEDRITRVLEDIIDRINNG